MKTALRSALLCIVGIAGSGSALGQDPADLSAREKTEIFIRHIVRLSGLEPESYRALILEYEIAAALDDFAHESPGGEPGAEGSHADELRLGELLGGFIERALAELYPKYRSVQELRAKGRAEEARRTAGELSLESDPYLAAHGRLAAAELDFETAGDREALEAVLRACETICAKDRLYLARDFRACQLAALCFERLSMPLLEFLQYAILLVDYNDIPKDVEAAVKERLAALAREIHWPLGTVADWMREVEKFLRQELTAKEPTQRRETEIVYALDKLIELQEARERRACSSCGSSSCRGGCRGGRPQGTRSSNPATVSALPNAPRAEILLRGVSRGDSSTIWGQLKAKEASRALQAFKGKLPAHYQQLLEKYYENLSKME